MRTIIVFFAYVKKVRPGRYPNQYFTTQQDSLTTSTWLSVIHRNTPNVLHEINYKLIFADYIIQIYFFILTSVSLDGLPPK